MPRQPRPFELDFLRTALAEGGSLRLGELRGKHKFGHGVEREIDSIVKQGWMISPGDGAVYLTGTGTALADPIAANTRT